VAAVSIVADTLKLTSQSKILVAR